MPNPEWLTDPTSANYVPPAERDPNAVRLLAGYPAPNTPPLAPGAVGRYQVSSPNINNTRQEVIRVDYDLQQHAAAVGTLHARPQRDARARRPVLQHRRSPASPAPTRAMPGQVGGVRPAQHHRQQQAERAELSLQQQQHHDRCRPKACATPRPEFGITIPEVFPENAAGLIPVIDVTGLSTARRQPAVSASSTSITRSPTTSRGSAATTPSRWAASRPSSRRTRTPPAAARAASRSWPPPAAPRRSRTSCAATATAPCTGCSYTEAERDIDLNLRFNRFEFYAQDTWRPTSRLTVDYGLRYSLYPPITDKNNLLVTFDPSAYNAAQAPPFANAAGTLIDRTQGNLLVGIIQGGVNSPYGDAHLRVPEGRLAAARRHGLRPVGQRRHHAAQRLRHLLRSAAGRHLRAELVHHAAGRQQRDVHQRDAVEPGERADARRPPACGRSSRRAPTSRIRAPRSGTSA